MRGDVHITHLALHMASQFYGISPGCGILMNVGKYLTINMYVMTKTASIILVISKKLVND